jgi:hypothetical protein
MDLPKYKAALNKSGALSAKFHERVLLKTHIDVVYSDFTNWERAELIFINTGVEKGIWKKLNYIEYVWIKIVEKLRKYGYSYAEIIFYKKELMGFVPPEQLLAGAFSKQEELDSIDPKVFKSLKEQQNNPVLIKNITNTVTYLELLMTNAIAYNEQVSILFDKDNPKEIGILSKSIIEEVEKTKLIDELLAQQNRTHLSVSLNQILSRFLLDDGCSPERQLFLSVEEHKLLKVIRNKPKSIISITIMFKNEKMDLLKIENFKKVELESRLMDHIQRGDYLNIEITTENGVITSFKNTKKIKL